MADYGSVSSLNNWINDIAGATIVSSGNLAATQHLQTWIQNGYFNADANSVSYPQMMANFQAGQGLFIFDGDWESGNFQSKFAGKYGFFAFPPLKAGGQQADMSAPLTYGIPANAKHADCAAFFLNWVATNPAARAMNVAVGGSNPGGPTNLPLPPVAKGSIIADTLAAGALLNAKNGTMGFVANATGGIYADAWTPEVQLLFAGQETPANLLKVVQAAYVKELQG
jgi:raffinose/stachyose/melibiose transport system substrate-binding protein